ncbi:MAG TPA: hypothetical protein VIU11_09340 [Nakamurella sp.]
MSGSTTAPARQLIDELIDRAHSEWPSVTFIIALPTGEQVLLPHHLAGLAPCRDGHAGYFSSVIRPHCAVDPVPRGAGTCRMVPLRRPPGGRQPPEYRLTLRSGEVTTYP